MSLLKFIRSLFGGEESKEEVPTVNKTIYLDPLNKWYISDVDVLAYATKKGVTMSVTYLEYTNRLELIIDGEASPANITSRSCTTLNSRLKKANKKPIPRDLFEQWESELIDDQGIGEGTYHSLRYPKKKA